MGNTLSRNTLSQQECIICWEQIQDIELVMCNICNIQLHVSCEEIYRNTRKYCKCPHCQGIGTLGIQ